MTLIQRIILVTVIPRIYYFFNRQEVDSKALNKEIDVKALNKGIDVESLEELLPLKETISLFEHTINTFHLLIVGVTFVLCG